MFNLTNLLGTKKTIKNTKNNFFSELSKADTSSEKNEDAHDDKFTELYNQGMEQFKQFLNSSQKNKSVLQSCGELFLEAQKIKTTDPRPYFQLSYIYFILADYSLAVEYLNIGKKLDSDNKYRAYIDNLTELISNKL